MLSAFSENWQELLIGVNIGGLGTLIASLASLISYKLYAASENAQSKRFMLVFTGFNVVFFVLLTALWVILS